MKRVKDKKPYGMDTTASQANKIEDKTGSDFLASLWTIFNLFTFDAPSALVRSISENNQDFDEAQKLGVDWRSHRVGDSVNKDQG